MHICIQKCMHKCMYVCMCRHAYIRKHVSRSITHASGRQTDHSPDPTWRQNSLSSQVVLWPLLPFITPTKYDWFPITLTRDRAGGGNDRTRWEGDENRQRGGRAKMVNVGFPTKPLDWIFKKSARHESISSSFSP